MNVLTYGIMFAPNTEHFFGNVEVVKIRVKNVCQVRYLWQLVDRFETFEIHKIAIGFDPFLKKDSVILSKWSLQSNLTENITLIHGRRKQK